MSAKREDSMYRKQDNARMAPIFKAAESIQPFFNRKTRKVNSQTNCLYVTGTIPHNISLGAAWEREISYHFNLFMTRLRRKYHRVWIVWRTWEANESGYPHFHAILYFPDMLFTCFRYKNKWRGPSRGSLRVFLGAHYEPSFKYK